MNSVPGRPPARVPACRPASLQPPCLSTGATTLASATSVPGRAGSVRLLAPPASPRGPLPPHPLARPGLLRVRIPPPTGLAGISYAPPAAGSKRPQHRVHASPATRLHCAASAPSVRGWLHTSRAPPPPPAPTLAACVARPGCCCRLALRLPRAGRVAVAASHAPARPHGRLRRARWRPASPRGRPPLPPHVCLGPAPGPPPRLREHPARPCRPPCSLLLADCRLLRAEKELKKQRSGWEKKTQRPGVQPAVKKKEKVRKKWRPASRLEKKVRGRLPPADW